MKTNYKTTVYACFIGYVVQAIVNMFIPLLFVTFQKEYSIPLSEITVLVTINFAIQLIVDMLSAVLIDKLGYRCSIIMAHVCVVIGFILLVILPEICSSPFIGIMIAVVIYAIGGGLLEVLVSPIIEACPTKNKESMMSLLHSFYSWGGVAVILLSTIFFGIFGTDNWKILAILWAIIPAINTYLFCKVPIYPLHEEEKGLTINELFKEKIFWVFMIMMFCSGACEQSVIQWVSTFVEQGLSISKTLGDLVGTMTFFVLMGTSRLIFGKYGDRIELDKFMIISVIMCVASYLCISIIPHPIISLLGCGICGFSVGILWPGTFSKASSAIKRGKTVLFAMLALAGDLGCSIGPTIVGFVSSTFNNNLRKGIFVATIFPVMLLILLIFTKIKKEQATICINGNNN